MSLDLLIPKNDPRLRQRCAQVHNQDPSLPHDIASLHRALQEFRQKHGFGRAIAAPQLGIMKRLIAVHLGATPFELVNPEVIWKSESSQEVWDDCLSLPDIVVRVQRHSSVSIRYEDQQRRTRIWENLPPDLAELIQHEIDHLDGILMTDRAFGADAVRPIDQHSALVGAARPEHRLSLCNIREATEVVTSVFLNSPQYNCETISEELDCKVILKMEHVNPIGNFKGRGASYLMHRIDTLKSTTRLVTASAGNWGQALAYCCRDAKIPVTIFASENANPLKLERMRFFGAAVELSGKDFDAAKHAARNHAEAINASFVEDGEPSALSEGHGTIGVELLRDAPDLDAVIIPLGNGALITGVGRWLKAASPATRVIGVCAQQADAMYKSWQTQRIVETSSAETIADGIAVRIPVPAAVADMHGLVDDILLVSESQIVDAMRHLAHHTGQLIEPAGAVALAGVMAHKEHFTGKSVAVVVSGGNITPAQVIHYGLIRHES